jgi:hypothetical protein
MATTRFAPGQKVASSPRPKGRGMCLPEVNSKGIAAVEDMSEQGRLIPGITDNAKDTLCRNVLIYGHCRYEDQGCSFNHEPNSIHGSQAEL